MSNIPERLIGIEIGDVLEFRPLKEIRKGPVKCGWVRDMDDIIGTTIVVTEDIMHRINSERDTIYNISNEMGSWAISLDMLQFVNHNKITKLQQEIAELKPQEFSFEKFLAGQIGIVCETYEESVMLLAYFAGKGLKWVWGQSAVDKTHLQNWNKYKDCTYYKYDNGIYFGNKENTKWGMVKWGMVKFDLSMIK